MLTSPNFQSISIFVKGIVQVSVCLLVWKHLYTIMFVYVPIIVYMNLRQIALPCQYNSVHDALDFIWTHLVWSLMSWYSLVY
jgi:hypothetical protein